MAAEELLKDNRPTEKAMRTARLIPYFDEIRRETLSPLINHAITTFDRPAIPLEQAGRSEAADVIVEARAQGRLTKAQESRLERMNPELKEILFERGKAREKYAITQATAAEIKNLRKTLGEVARAVDPVSWDSNDYSAEHARMEALNRVATSADKAMRIMTRSDVRNAHRERGGHEL